ncbi:MAG: Gfo/Idh/MocA family oxidoreductase, partial [Candidatus Acidiferrales bacterium]
MNQQPSIAVVGCGYWGKNLVRNFSELGSLHGVCDCNRSRSGAMAEQYGVRRYESYEGLLESDDIQAVVISAPASDHFELAKRGLLSGKDVFVEKPLALTVDEGLELSDLANKSSLVLMVGHLLRYHPAIQKLKQLIQSGSLGKVQYIYSSRLNFGKIRTEENILWSFAPHDVSTLLYLLEDDPISVTAHGGAYLNSRVADLTLSSFQFADGVNAHIFVSWLHPFKEQRIVVVGDAKMAVFDDMERKRKLVLFPHQIEWIDRHPIARMQDGQPVEIDEEEPLRKECRHFLECLATRRAPETDGKEGVRVLRILNACERSLKENGRPQQLRKKVLRYFVHPSAQVDEPCQIGDATQIWHFSHIMHRSQIGKNCNLGQNVFVAGDARIGDHVKIQNNVSIYSGVQLEDDVFCGPSAVFTNVVNPRSRVNRKHEFQKTIVRRGATIGANATIVCG